MKEANNVGTTVHSFRCVSFIELSDLYLSCDVTSVHVPTLSGVGVTNSGVEMLRMKGLNLSRNSKW